MSHNYFKIARAKFQLNFVCGCESGGRVFLRIAEIFPSIMDTDGMIRRMREREEEARKRALDAYLTVVS
jgi:hypothetical protein